MNDDQQSVKEEESVPTQRDSAWRSRLNIVTPFSKYLALVLFIVLPFIGFWAGVEYSAHQTQEMPLLYVAEFNKNHIIVDGKGTHSTYRLSDDFSKLPDALIVSVCSQGGYDVSEWEGREVMHTSFPIQERYEGEPLDVHVISVGGGDLCVYKSVREDSTLTPGIFPASIVQENATDTDESGVEISDIQLLCDEGDSCCWSSVTYAQEHSYNLVPFGDTEYYGDCPKGYVLSGMRCPTSHSWCEPASVVIDQKTSLSAGDYVDITVDITTWEAETGGGDETYYTIGMYDQNDVYDMGFMIGGLGDNSVSCVDPNLWKGDVARLKGSIVSVAPEYTYGMRCDQGDTSITRLDSDFAEWMTYTSETFGMSFKYPHSFKGQSNTNTLVEIADTTNNGSMYITLRGTQGVYDEPSEQPGGEWIMVDDIQAYRYYYREGAGYSGVLIIQVNNGTLTLTYDAISTGKNESEIQSGFQQIIDTIEVE